MTILHSESGEELVVAVKSNSAGDDRILALAPLLRGDLAVQRAETWLEGLRAGKLGEDPNQLKMQIVCGAHHDSQLGGYFVELSDGAQTYRRHFSTQTLSAVAQRAIVPLIEQGDLRKNDTIRFYLTTLPRDDFSVHSAADTVAGESPRITVRHEPVLFDSGVLADYIAASRPLVSPVLPLEAEAENPIHVFISSDAWQAGFEFARRGGEKESAGLWVGRVFRDSASPEVFLTLEECLEVRYAEEEQYSVTLTGESWANARALLAQRRKRLGRPQEALIGSVHGHNFMPAADETGNRRCESCSVAERCSRSTAVASSADQTWHASIFSAAPWSVLLIWGYSAREEDVWNLYGISNAALAPRGLRILKD